MEGVKKGGCGLMEEDVVRGVGDEEGRGRSLGDCAAHEHFPVI